MNPLNMRIRMRLPMLVTLVWLFSACRGEHLYIDNQEDGGASKFDGGVSSCGFPSVDGRLDLLAGSLGGPGFLDGVGDNARFNWPSSIAIDAESNLYVTDQFNHVIRKINSSGVVSTLAGSPGCLGYADGIGSAAKFDRPAGVAIDSSGNLYVTDLENCAIRKVTPEGIVSTIAGNPGTCGNADGKGSAARFYSPSSITIDSSGNLYVTDVEAIRKITPGGVVSTIAGNQSIRGSVDGTGSDARFNSPSGMAVDSSGNLYVADSENDTIRKITPSGVVTTFAGSPGTSGYADGVGSSAQFDWPSSIIIDVSGNLYVAVSNGIRKISPNATVSTLPGTTSPDDACDSVGGNGQAAAFCGLLGIARDGTGNFYVVDSQNHTVRKITPSGVLTTVAGRANLPGSSDGTGSAARFRSPDGIAVDNAGNTYVAESENGTIRKVTPTGVVTTFASTADGLEIPISVAVDRGGNVYVADVYTIRKISSTGVVTTLAGSPGNQGNIDGIGSAARFYSPQGIAVDGTGNVYVSDDVTIRKITSTGVVTTLAGSPGNQGNIDGIGSAARFYSPQRIAVDGTGNVYVSDWGNATIRKISPGGIVTTLAGGGPGTLGNLDGGTLEPWELGSLDGIGSGARFICPTGIAIDTTENLYVADQCSETIRKVTPTGVVTTVFGWPGVALLGASPNFASFSAPANIAVTPSGDLIVTALNAVLKVTF